jgi:hypothetical protein
MGRREPVKGSKPPGRYLPAGCRVTLFSRH